MNITPFPLYGTDAAWWKMNHAANPVIITALLRFETPINRQTLIATLERGIAPFPQFRSRVVNKSIGFPFWEAVADFEVAAHVHEYPTPAPVSFEMLEAVVGTLMSQPFPLDQPLWQAYLIEEATGGTALVFRVHHAIGDGAALVHFLLSLTQGMPDAPIHTRRSTKPAWYEPFRFALSLLVTPFVLLFMPPEGKNTFRGPLSTTKRAVWSQPIPLEQVKAIGKATNSTVNDVLIAAVAGALHPLLAEQGIREVRTAIPVALRAFGKTPQLENHIGLVFLQLPVGVSSPMERLEVLKKRMSALKRSPQALITFAVLWLAGYLPTILARGLAWFLGTKITAVMTNVPGPQVPLTLAGATISQLMFWVPEAGNCGLGISLLSYNGTVVVGFSTDEGLISEELTNSLLDNFHSELQNLADLRK
jgi:diacylglycerol O-acyltransferase / wax synthase